MEENSQLKQTIESNPDEDKVIIKVKDQNRSEPLNIKVRKHSKFSKVIKAYLDRFNVSSNKKIKFVYGNEEINPDHSISQVLGSDIDSDHLRDNGFLVYANSEQIGGAK